jgi:hypothetical protein
MAATETPEGPGVPRRAASERGSATVEQTGLILLVAALFAVIIGLRAVSGEDTTGTGLGERIANRIACGPREPGACRHHPAVEAYDWPIARALRALAPTPVALPGPGGQSLLPVDFRYCRRPSCASPRAGSPGLGLTASNRRVTLFTEVTDRRRSTGRVELTYWLYRPGLGWEAVRRSAGAPELAAASGTRVLLKDTPSLVPLETLDGRNHYRFPPAERPPWQWRLGSSYEGRSG